MSRSRILIVDDNRFGRICGALLKDNGYTSTYWGPERVKNLGEKDLEADLVIASFSKDSSLLSKVQKQKIPVVLLSDSVCPDLLREMRKLQNVWCMVKPIQYEKFNKVIRRIMTNLKNLPGGCQIV